MIAWVSDHQPRHRRGPGTTGRDELEHGVAEAREDRPKQKDDDRGLEETLASVLVTELAPSGVRPSQLTDRPTTIHERWEARAGLRRSSVRRRDDRRSSGQNRPKQQSEDDDGTRRLTESRYRCQVGEAAPLLNVVEPMSAAGRVWSGI